MYKENSPRSDCSLIRDCLCFDAFDVNLNICVQVMAYYLLAGTICLMFSANNVLLTI